MGVNTPGDLGRRVAERQRELGLSDEELAERAGMDPVYLHFIETNAAAQVSPAALLRIAAALGTTAAALEGGGIELPPGTHGSTRPSMLGELDREESMQLIRPGGVGRIVFVEARGPVALPVNYRMMGDDVVFRTQATAGLLSAMDSGVVSFEVDHVDTALAEGWSVLLSGHAHRVEDAAELERVRRLGVTPWAGGERNIVVSVEIREVTGRRIRRL